MTTPQEAIREKVVSLRREFHQFPELSREEKETALRVCRELDLLQIQYQTNVGGHGILAEIPGKQAGQFVALRADMDALPVHEETGLDFTSAHPGVMHACGHDAHMSMLLGAARLLVEGETPELSVRLIFQPAEELAEGAELMIKAEALKDVAMVFGGHVDRHYKAGEIVVAEGAMNASVDDFLIEINGQGAHGARPHESIDAVVVGSLMVVALQTIVSREIDPAFPSVVSIGEFKAGTASNVIASRATLSGTVRSQHSEVREQLKSSIQRMANSIAELHGALVSISYRGATPELINPPQTVSIAHRAAVSVVGEQGIVPLRSANMGGEDFSCYMQHVPGCYVRYGSQKKGSEGFPAHSSKFDIDERVLPIGAAYLAAVAREAGAKLVNGE